MEVSAAASARASIDILPNFTAQNTAELFFLIS